MKKLINKWKTWFFQIENEIMLPFISVCALVIVAFSAISFYNGYTMEMESQRERAETAFQRVNVDILYSLDNGNVEELEEKYRLYGEPALRITAKDGRVITGPQDLSNSQRVIHREEGGNEYGWTLEYIIDNDKFGEKLIEKQNYVIVGAVSSLLIIVQVSVFLAWSLTKPIRSMSATCREIDNNKKNFRRYRFEAVTRRDEIGQLARTFEGLLKNLDNYTKMEYTSRMSATLAHEIKNPLAGIRSGVQVLQGRVEKENEKLLCNSMIHEIDRVTGLINNLFTLSVKKANNKQEFRLEPFLEEISILYAKGLGQQNIQFLTEVEDGLSLYGDENEIRQIFHNLMTNSLKAMDSEKDGVITLKAVSKGEKVQMTFSDNGHGMTKEELEQAREPFYTKSINGVGLGLSIVSRLVEANLGTMEMDSVYGEGTQVELEFYRERSSYEESNDR